MKATLPLLALLILVDANPALSQQPGSPALCVLCSVEPVTVQADPTGAAARQSPGSQGSGLRGSASGAFAGGLIGGIVGGIGLGYAAYHLSGGSKICGDDPCGLLAGATGLLFGEMIGVGIGVHLGNGRQGSVGADVGVAIASVFVGGGLLSSLGEDYALPAALGTLGLQFSLTIAVERGLGRVRTR